MIRQERIRRNWTQNYVAQQTGITQTMLQKIETGMRKPSFDVLVKIEDLFQKDYRKLFDLPERQFGEIQKKPEDNQAKENISYQNNTMKKDKL